MRDYSKLSLEERKAINAEMKRLMKEEIKGGVRKMGQMGKKVGGALYGALSGAAAPLLNRFGKKLPAKGYKIEKKAKFQKTK
jgi:hypothetical protein